MTTIRTTCTSCGDIELTHNNLRLELTPEWTSGSYCFTCPYCSKEESRPASQRVVTILLAAGVVYEVMDEETPISETEIGEFRDALDTEDWFSELTSS
ncbi:MAG: hypothetical protein OEM22_06785 [Acidimicrobiia bacterium]|nr:hypothetical protein [Acidimicrobiia bacterium]MDH3471151.1 hypothetical protein [Acidimicrobiia bacterium]